LFVVPDLGPHEGLLPAAVVAPIRRWLAMLAGPDRARTVIGRTLRGSLAALRPWVDELAEAVQAQADAAGAIASVLDAAIEAPTAQASASIRGGAVADGAVRARWSELAAESGPLGRVVRPSGRIRGSSREGRARVAAIEPLVEDLTRSAAATLTAAGAHTEGVLRAALTGADAPAGGASVDAAWESSTLRTGRRSTAEQAARAWTAQGPRVVRAALTVGPAQTSPDGISRPRRDVVREARRRTKAVNALGDEGLAAVALAAASGVREARDLLVDLIDTAGERAADELRDDLVARVAGQVAVERAAVGEVLSDPDLAEDASSRLRLRLAVLKGLT
jgi:hypothetical protein